MELLEWRVNMNIDKNTLGKQYKSLKQLKNDYDKIQDYMVKCKCSHTILFTGRKDRLLCSHCGRYVYKDKDTEIKYKIREYLK